MLNLPVPKSAAKSEVRKCAQCGDAAVVLVFEWIHSYAGVDVASSTRDYRCQNCGAKFSLHPKVGSWTFIVLGLLMGFAIFPLGFTLFGWLRLRRDAANPVVPGAPRPQLRFKDGPPRRRCNTCGDPVALTKVTRNTSKGIPTGTEYEYVCNACKKKFTIESVWGHCFSAMAGCLLGGIAAMFFITSTSPGWRYGGGGAALLLTAFVFFETGTRIANRFRYPVID